MSIDRILELTYTLSLAGVLWATALSIGLRLTLPEIAASFKQTRLMGNALLLNIVIFPAVVWLLVKALSVEQGAAIGLFLLGAAAGGPYGLKVTQIARGNTTFALSLIVILQATRIVVIPLWIAIYLAQFVFGDLAQLMGTLVAYILLPLSIGLLLRARFATRSAQWAEWARRVGSVLLVILIVSAVAFYRETLAALVLSVGMVLILAIQLVAIGLGYLFGGPESASRRTLALTTAFRSSATALLLAEQVFRTQPQAAATVIVYGVSVLIVTTLTALAMARTEQPIPQPT